ncbi:MAG: transglycosylase, partial [Clostridia bacterium]|nr:transglycosylase [Clostridia bacterium]
ALGGLTDGATTLEMAAAFSTFPRYGTYITPRTYLMVKANDGTVLIDNQPQTSVAIKESTAWYMNYMLKNAVAQGTGTSANFKGQEIAGKTGTTSSRKDLWFVGYTPYYTAAVWTGYDQPERMGSSMQQTAVTMWKKVMGEVHTNLEYKDFGKPESLDLVTADYCKDSGGIPTDECKLDPRGSRVASGTFVKGDQPTQYCTVHKTMKVCIDSPILDANGAPTGLFHEAGSYCPAESVRDISLVDYLREGPATTVLTRDHSYMMSYFTELGSAALCTVHTTESVPEPTPPSFENIDPLDPSTWPDSGKYPNFNPFDPTTWPGYVPPGAGTETTPETPGASPTPGTDEPFVPAGRN